MASTSELGVRLAEWASYRRFPWAKAFDSVLIIAMAGLLIYLFWDTRFYVSGITLSGNRLVSAEDVYRRADIHGWSIFYVNTARLTKNLTERLPEIRSAQVRCRLPARVIVTLQERIPQIVWETSNGRFLVDAEGVVLQAAQTTQDKLLIRDYGGPPVNPGDIVEKRAIETAQQLQALLGDTTAFYYTHDKGITWREPHGWEVFFGLGGDLSVKVANLWAIVRKIKAEGLDVSYIDVRFESSPRHGPIRQP